MPRNLNMKTFSIIRRWYSKYWMVRKSISSTWLIISSILLSLFILKKGLGYSYLVTRIHFVHMQLELSLIMLQSENINLDFFPVKNLSVCVVYTLLKHEDIFSSSVKNSMAIGIQKETFLAILLCFWRLIQMHLLL